MNRFNSSPTRQASPRNPRIFRLFRLATALLLALITQTVTSADKVVLQLKWEHEFQFAGYYAALWQGYYANEGLDVEIRPASTADGRLLNPAEELNAGRADFAIGALDILINKDQGQDLVVLAPIFQRSPNSIFALPGTRLGSVVDLSKLRIATPANDFTRTEVMALFRARGIDPAEARFVDAPPTVGTLIDDVADAIATYSISARTDALERGIELQELSPTRYGLDFYGDTLYTHSRLQQRDPALVERFLRASLKGWQYALENRQQVASKISRTLTRNIFSYKDQEAYNQAFAGIIDEYMAYPYLEVGHNNPMRWTHMVKELRAVGVINTPWEVDSLFPSRERRSHTELITSATVLVMTLVVATGFYLLRRQRRAWLSYALILGGVLLTEITLEDYWRRIQQQKLRLDATEQINAISARLVGSINNTLSLIRGLAAHISINPDIQQPEFERYARAVLRQEPLLINLAAAPDMVIKLIHPLAGNAKALGLDYRLHDEQRTAAERARSSGQMVIAGPVNMVQGGIAFIGRTAVFTEAEDGSPQFWGIVSAPLDANALYQASGLLDPEMDIDIAIRGKDGLGSDGEVFYGEESLFSDALAVQTSIAVGDGAWLLAAKPKHGWGTNRTDVWALRGGSLTLASLLLFIALYRSRQLSNERRYQRALQESENLLQEVGELALIGGFRLNANKAITFWSPPCAQALGIELSNRHLGLQDILDVFDPQQAATLIDKIDGALAGKAFDIELFYTTAENSKRWLRTIGTPAPSNLGPNRYDMIGAIQDITERKQFTDVIQQQATYDLLTGLPNRFLFNNRLAKSIAKAKRDQRKLAVLFIDLDNFKPVNDNLGHQAGDQLLQEVGRRVKSSVRESDTVARYSGDEFTVIIQDIEDASVPLACAKQIIQSLNQPYELGANQVFCSASIGISVFPDDGDNAEELVSNADQAMYEVKKSGRNGWHYFTQAMQAQSEKRHKLHTQLATALSEKRLQVYYQPIVSLTDNRVAKCEALVRWFENGEQIPTSEFVGLAEETGLINEIDRFVLTSASRYLTELARTHGHRVGLSINVSPRVFSAKDNSLQLWLSLVTQAAQSLAVTVEITERLLIEDSERALEVLARLKAIGVTIAIDDFGTGYSSLSYLTKFPIDIIKIDRSFVSKLGQNNTASTLTDAIISLSQKLSLQVVAEGVETEEQLTHLQMRGCNFAQGYFLAKPESDLDFAERLEYEKRPESTSETL